MECKKGDGDLRKGRKGHKGKRGHKGHKGGQGHKGPMASLPAASQSRRSTERTLHTLIPKASPNADPTVLAPQNFSFPQLITFALRNARRPRTLFVANILPSTGFARETRFDVHLSGHIKRGPSQTTNTFNLFVDFPLNADDPFIHDQSLRLALVSQRTKTTASLDTHVPTR